MSWFFFLGHHWSTVITGSFYNKNRTIFAVKNVRYIKIKQLLTSWRAGVAAPHPQHAQGWCWWVYPVPAAQACCVRSALHGACASWPETQTWWKLWRADLSHLLQEEWHPSPPKRKRKRERRMPFQLESPFLFLNGATFVRRMHLWGEDQSCTY